MNPSFLNQARELKSKLDKAQKELSDTIVEASSGKGAVKVTITGHKPRQGRSPGRISAKGGKRRHCQISKGCRQVSGGH